MPIARLLGVLALLALVALAGLGLSARVASSQSADELQFADWTSASNNSGSGTLRGVPITFSGTNSNPAGWTTNGSETRFSTSSFTPPLPATDAAYFDGYMNYAYSLHFGSPMRDPVLHLASLASRLDFPAGTSISRLSGESGFSVSGNSVIGSLDASSDADGTVRLNGTFTDVSFTATKVYAADTHDGIYLQVGALGPVGSPPPPAPQVTAVETPAAAPAPVVGKAAVLTAQVSGDAKGLAWDLRGDSTPEIISNSLSQNSVRFRPQAGTNTIHVYPILASGLLGDAITKTFVAPTPPQTTTQRKVINLVRRRSPVDLTGAGDTLIGTGGKTCTTPVNMRSRPLDVRGCLTPIKSVDDIPLLDSAASSSGSAASSRSPSGPRATRKSSTSPTPSARTAR